MGVERRAMSSSNANRLGRGSATSTGVARTLPRRVVCAGFSAAVRMLNIPYPNRAARIANSTYAAQGISLRDMPQFMIYC